MHRATLTFLFLLVFCSSAFASCEVSTSFIKGSSEPQQEQKIEAEILEQLKNLPFSSFNLLKKEVAKVDYNSVATFLLNSEDGDNKVAITPFQKEGDKIQALIEWTSATGENILSSKMWFTNGGNMVFGTENGETRCTVINVSINCGK